MIYIYIYQRTGSSANHQNVNGLSIETMDDVNMHNYALCNIRLHVHITDLIPFLIYVSNSAEHHQRQETLGLLDHAVDAVASRILHAARFMSVIPPST